MKIRHLVWLRRITQMLFLLFFLFLLIESRLPQNIYVDYTASFSAQQDLRLEQPVTFFFQLDPLVVVSSLISGHQFIEGFLWATALIIITVLLGRVFCGFICPFGTIHHATGSFKAALKGGRMAAANCKTSAQKIKYFNLIALLVASIIGLNLTGLLDPISFLFRSVALAVLPGLGAGLRGFFDALAVSDIKLLNLMSYGAEILVAPIFGYSPRAFQTAWFIGFVFLVILFLNRIRPRFWCRFICPLGALLGIFSRVSVLRLEKYPQKCTQCNLCLKHCQAAASPRPDQTWETAECHMCFNCHNVCPEDALAFRFS